MFGWLSEEAACASLSKRRNREASAEAAAGRILIATSRPSRTSFARYTVPMPPRPSSSRISYGPNRARGEKSMDHGRLYSSRIFEFELFILVTEPPRHEEVSRTRNFLYRESLLRDLRSLRAFVVQCVTVDTPGVRAIMIFISSSSMSDSARLRRRGCSG